MNDELERCPNCSKKVSSAELEQNGYMCHDCWLAIHGEDINEDN